MTRTWFDLLALLLGAMALGGAAVWLGHRALGKPGPTTGVGDAFGTMIDVFHPAHARAMRDLKQHEDAGPVVPSPDDDDDDRTVLLIRDPSGRPIGARIRRPRP